MASYEGRAYTRADAMEIAIAMRDLYAEIRPDLPEWAKSEVRYWLYRSIIGECSGLWSTYAADMCYWLRRNITSAQYDRFKAVQALLVDLGVIPGPRKSD